MNNAVTAMNEMINRRVRELRALNACPKCGGRGHIPEYAHVSGGSCFACSGTGESMGPRAARAAARLEREIAELRAEAAAAAPAAANTMSADLFLMICELNPDE